MYNREIVINMECVKEVEEWLEIQEPENMCEDEFLEEAKKSTEFVKTHVLRNDEKESAMFSERINNENGFLELCIDDEIMSYRAYLFKIIYAAITVKSSITIKELTDFNPLREMCLINQKVRGEKVSRAKTAVDCVSSASFWKDIYKDARTADFIALTEDDFEPPIKRFQD